MFGKSYTELKESLDPPLLLWLIISSVFLLGCLFVAYLEHKAGRSLSIGIAAFISNFMWAQNPMLYIWRQSQAELSKHWTCFYQYVGLTCLIHITWVEVVILETNSSMDAFLPCLVSFLYFVFVFYLTALMLVKTGAKEVGGNDGA